MVNPSQNDPVLELSDVSFVRNGKNILQEINLRVMPYEHWALLGANGAGKSTILNLCGALAHPTTGIVHILGEQVGRVELRALRQKIGHVNPRHVIDRPLTISEVVLTGLTGTRDLLARWEPSAAELQKAQDILNFVGLAGKSDYRWPVLSQGERGRTLIARALMLSPELLLLDEPTTGLDVAAREQLLETLSKLSEIQEGLASILVTHHLEELPTSTTHAFLIADGQEVISGSAEQIITTENITHTFDHPIRVQRMDGRWIAQAEAVFDKKASLALS